MLYFENLSVYKKAFSVNQELYRMLKNSITIPFYMKDQLGRACLSIQLNIAEGCAKTSKRERANFYRIARGSAFECAALVNFLAAENEIPIQDAEKLYSNLEEISKMLFAMVKNLTGQK